MASPDNLESSAGTRDQRADFKNASSSAIADCNRNPVSMPPGNSFLTTHQIPCTSCLYGSARFCMYLRCIGTT